VLSHVLSHTSEDLLQ